MKWFKFTKNTKTYRPVQYANPNLVTNIIRINRFDIEQPDKNNKLKEIKINVVENGEMNSDKNQFVRKLKSLNEEKNLF